MARRTLMPGAMIALLAASSPPQVRGQVLAYEGFNYTAGASLNGLNGGSGWGSTWSEPSFGAGDPNDNVAETIQAASLAFGSLTTSGNRVLTGGKFSYDIRNLAAPLGATGTTRYASFLLRRTTAGPDPVNNGPDYGGLVFGDENNPNSLFVGKPGGGATTNYALESGNGTGQVATALPEVLGTTAFLVVRLDFLAGNDTLRLFVNPAPGQPEPGAASATKTDLDLGSFVGVSISTGALATWNVDEIRIGNTFADVTPVPEPGAVSLVSLVLMSGAVARSTRRRHQSSPSVALPKRLNSRGSDRPDSLP